MIFSALSPSLPYQAFLWRESQPLLSLSREHIASDEAERKRVLTKGGTVQLTSDGKLRVGGVIQVNTNMCVCKYIHI